MKPWGQYYIISFLGDKYFAAYSDTQTATMIADNLIDPWLYNKSTSRNLMINRQISKVLMDDNMEMTVTSSTPLKLEEGYELAIKYIDVDGNKVYLELSKKGSVVDSKVVSPSKDNPTMDDKTYYYKKDVGDSKDLIIIAAHFKNAFRGADSNLATIDGIFQISDMATTLESEKQYDKMAIRNVNSTAMTITMDNKENPIILRKNEDIVLMQDIHIKTADQDAINDSQPLRYYIYKVEVATIEKEFHGYGSDFPKSFIETASVPIASIDVDLIEPGIGPLAPTGEPIVPDVPPLTNGLEEPVTSPDNST